MTDQDAGQAGFQAVAAGALAGTCGSFTFTAATGAWTYALDDAADNVQALGDGETLTETLQVRSLDGTASQDITVTINGADEPSAGSRAIVVEAGIPGDDNNDGAIGAGETTEVVFNGAGKNADLATEAWTVQFEAVPNVAIDIIGFDGDDKIVLDVEGIFQPAVHPLLGKDVMNFATAASYDLSSGFLANGANRLGAQAGVFWNAVAGRMTVSSVSGTVSSITTAPATIAKWITGNAVL